MSPKAGASSLELVDNFSPISFSCKGELLRQWSTSADSPMTPGGFLVVLGEAPKDTLAGLGCGLWDSSSELEDLLIGLDGLEDLLSGSDGLEHLSAGPEGLEDLFKELGELAVLGGELNELGEMEERGDLLMGL